METLKPTEALDEGLAISEISDTRNPCNESFMEVSEVAASAEFDVSVEKVQEQELPSQALNVAASTEKCFEPVAPKLDETQSPCGAMLVEVPEIPMSVEKLTEQGLPSLNQAQNNCYGILGGDPDVAGSTEKCFGPVAPSLVETQSSCGAMLVPENSMAIEKLTEHEPPSCDFMQDQCDEIHAEDAELIASSLDETPNCCDTVVVEIPDTEKITHQHSPSFGPMQNHSDGNPSEDPELATSAEKCTGPVSSSFYNTENHCNESSVAVPEFSVSGEELTGQASPSLGQQHNHCDEIPQFSSLEEKFAEQISPTGGSVAEDACEVDSDRMVDLPTNGICLFVELNNSANGLGKSVLPEKSLSNGSLLQENGNLTEKSGNELGGEFVKDEECRFDVDDLVWAKTKTHLWLPGIVYDPLSAPKEARKTDINNCLLVKLLGNTSFAWCLPSQLKPFLGFFRQMSNQSYSKNFLGALKEALSEFGRRVKLEMTCPCFSNGFKDKKGNFREFSKTQFEPASFLASIKSLARDVSGRDKIECIVIQNQLSVFYQSIGHFQIPFHELTPVNEGKDTAEDEELAKLLGEDQNTVSNKGSSKSVKTFNLENGDKSSDGKSGRERRKSRYLSYPYVDIKQGRIWHGEDEVEEPKEVSPVEMDKNSSQPMGSPSSIKSVIHKSQKTWSGKGTNGNDRLGTPVKIISSSAEVLSELRHVAIDCLYPRGSKQFGETENSILTYRKMEYQSGELTSDQTAGQELQQPLLNVLPKKRGRKKEQLSDIKTSPTPILPGVEAPSDIGMLNSNEMAGNELVKQSLANTVHKKRGRKKKEKDFKNVTPVAAAENVGIQPVEVMPFNGKNTILNIEDSQVNPSLRKQQPKKRKKDEKASNLDKLDSVLQEVHVMGPSMVQTIPKVKKKRVKKPTWHLVCEEPDWSVDYVSDNDGAQPTERKRKRKKKAMHYYVTQSEYLELNGIGSEGEPQKKRNKNINNAETCIDNSKLQKNGDVSGPSLVLKFGAGEPVPSKEALLSAFRWFGPLKEQETQPLESSDLAHVVFETYSNALDAFRSLEKNSPFGPALVNFQLYNVSGEVLEGNKMPSGKVSGEGKDQAQEKEVQDLPGIRKNLEMMTSMLKNSGDKLTPEMRGKLETQVKGLLEKVSEMVAD